MNIYDALNQGDASLREPHFTSLLFYFFKISKEEYPQRSFLDLFINKYIPEFPNSTECDFDLETGIKIEEILIHDNLRRDTDILIFLRHNGVLKIVNIENKINNLAYQYNQIDDQNTLLSVLYPDSEIINIIILPYITAQNINLRANLKIIYWHSENNSLIEALSEYINEIIGDVNLQIEKIYFLNSLLALLSKFSYVLEQDRLSNANMPRGPRNNYRHSMFEYLENIANDWEDIFIDNPENVTVNELLLEFDSRVCNHLQIDFPNDFNEMAVKFRNGALKEQPKIMTINEKNRVHFRVTNPYDKHLFYYPDEADGNISGRWINRRIKPIRLMNENTQYLIYWRDLETNENRNNIYLRQD